ncbi:MAG: hypothetical protein K0R18_181 [Bacillales bacterium]|jgi:hypothetical protein|nr:hypothetical protein [Bacillales bacterium]
MIRQTQKFQVGDKVHFMLEDKYEIKGTVVYTGLYYKQIDPSTDKPIAKFGYSEKILNRMMENRNVIWPKFLDYKAYVDDEVYKIVGNAVEVEFDTPLYYNGVEMNDWTFKESHILKNLIGE